MKHNEDGFAAAMRTLEESILKTSTKSVTGILPIIDLPAKGDLYRTVSPEELRLLSHGVGPILPSAREYNREVMERLPEIAKQQALERKVEDFQFPIPPFLMPTKAPPTLQEKLLEASKASKQIRKVRRNRKKGKKK